ncbi:anti-sigma factor [Myxosarcina sp. GI1]|uniref:anti-sigma factor n=1 Tax=Myxosarcina sp. GI1 TaxID=1541065 RepID=UPI00068E04DF|nr:anti-sigma factor [Myxosarcina sp. GI1]
MALLSSECEQLLVAGYVLGNLNPVEAALFKEILAENPELIQQVAEFQQALTLAYESPEVALPNGLKAKILAAVPDESANTRANRNSRVKLLGLPKLKLPWFKVLGAIAAAAIVGLGIANYRLWQTLQTAALEAPVFRQLVYTLQSQEAEGPVVIFSISPDRLEGRLRAFGLEPLPADRVYVLWTVVGKDAPFTTDNKGAILTAVFHVNEDGTLSRNIFVPEVYQTSQAIQKVAVTIENKSAPQAHLGSILLVADRPQNALKKPEIAFKNNVR